VNTYPFLLCLFLWGVEEIVHDDRESIYRRTYSQHRVLGNHAHTKQMRTPLDIHIRIQNKELVGRGDIARYCVRNFHSCMLVEEQKVY